MAACVSLVDLSIFCRMFSTMLSAGVPPARCLGVLSQQQRSRKFKRVIAEVQREVTAGNMLSKSLAKYPGTFSNLFIGLVRAGEIGSVLEETLQRLSTFLEKDVEMKRKIKPAMTYPILIAISLVLIVIGLGAFISQPFWN
jgi:type IV pilus assembly protein PilC